MLELWRKEREPNKRHNLPKSLDEPRKKLFSGTTGGTIDVAALKRKKASIGAEDASAMRRKAAAAARRVPDGC